jgi:AraC-like DNA-binding protein
MSVEQAAGEFGISSAYACRLCRRYGTTSPYQELLMTLAADLLTHEGLQVQQAAARLGFTDASQFSRAFKRVTGVSPQHLPTPSVTPARTRSSGHPLGLRLGPHHRMREARGCPCR